MTELLLNLRDVAIGYGGDMVLSRFSLGIARGDQIALIGRNGCGKSTLLRAISGELSVRSGRATFKDRSINGLPFGELIRRGVGYLRQDRNVFPSLTVRENLDLAAFGYPKHSVRTIPETVDHFLMLRDSLCRRAGSLSGGERRALAVAMVLRRRVSLLLLDEPLAGLSIDSAHCLMSTMFSLAGSDGTACVVAEHRHQQLRPFVNRVVRLDAGQINLDVRDAAEVAAALSTAVGSGLPEAQK